MTKILTLKTRCFLAYCHDMLQEGVEQDKQNKGTIIINNDEDLKETRELSNKIKEFLEINKCTKDFLSRELNESLRPTAKKYYETIIREYYKFFEDRIVPSLFAQAGIEFLIERSIITADEDFLNTLDKVKFFYTQSKHLEKKEVKFMGKTKIRNVEVLKYSDCIESIFKSLDNCKRPKRVKRKKR